MVLAAKSNGWEHSVTPAVVSTPAALAIALKTAGAGAIILLSPGQWKPVSIADVRTPGVITIRSQDPAHPAIIPELTVKQSEGLDLTDLTLATELRNLPGSNVAEAPFKVLNSRRINLRRLSVHGTMDGNPRDDVHGLQISDSEHVSVSDSEFQQLYVALIDYRNIYLEISNNRFHDIRDDGIDNAGSSYVTVSGNHFTDFYPIHIGGAGDHPDAIQFWTANTNAPAHDLTITGNTFERGRGLWIQGVFVTDQAGLPYERVTITRNTIIGGMYNGIMVQGCDGLTIADNTVQPYSDRSSWIRVEKCDNVTVSHNRAGDYLYKGNGRLTGERNEKISSIPSPFGAPPSDNP